MEDIDVLRQLVRELELALAEEKRRTSDFRERLGQALGHLDEVKNKAHDLYRFIDTSF